jgi:hypothetical protein
MKIQIKIGEVEINYEEDTKVKDWNHLTVNNAYSGANDNVTYAPLHDVITNWITLAGEINQRMEDSE